MDKEQETGVAGLADLWLWPFGMWKTATDAWLNYMTGFLGVDGARGGNGKPQPLPGFAVDPWAIMKIWMPQVDTVVEPLSQGDDEAVRVRMRMQLPGLGASEVVAIDAVVAREAPADKPAPVIEAEAPRPVAAPRKAPVRRAKAAVETPAAAAAPEAAAPAPKPRRPRKPAEPKASAEPKA